MIISARFTNIRAEILYDFKKSLELKGFEIDELKQTGRSTIDDEFLFAINASIEFEK